MPTQAEYAQLFEQAQGRILDMAVTTRAGVSKLCSEARRRTVKERNRLTLEISGRWKTEFAKIKLENDQWQKALDAAFHAAMQDIDEQHATMNESIQR